jgi:hypothetical protein
MVAHHKKGYDSGCGMVCLDVCVGHSWSSGILN